MTIYRLKIAFIEFLKQKHEHTEITDHLRKFIAVKDRHQAQPTQEIPVTSGINGLMEE